MRTNLLIIAAIMMIFNGNAIAVSLSDQINQLNSEVARKNDYINQLKGEQDTLKSKLAQLQANIDTAKSALDLTKNQISDVENKIAENQVKLTKNKELLATSFKLMVKQGKVSTIELLVSSNSLSDFVNRENGLKSIKSKVNDTIEEINTIQADLNNKKEQLSSLRLAQDAQVVGLNEQITEQQRILAETQGEESRYQEMLSGDKAKIGQLQKEQAAAIAAAMAAAAQNNNISSAIGGAPVHGGTGGYPWINFPLDGGVDPWGFYYRECTSYAAWKRSALGNPIPAWGSMGPANAKTWASWARSFGMSVDKNPRVGDVGVYTGGYYGHVMIVEEVLGNGYVKVSQYNDNFTGLYSTATWPVSSLEFIH